MVFAANGPCALSRDLTTTRLGSPIQSYAFTLYPAGNRHTIAEAGGTLRTYVYDDLYRLTSETVTGGPHQYARVFTYDDVGNRETQTTTGGPTPPPGAISYGYDDRDRLTTETGVTGGYGYDTNGNLTDKADGATDYAWDRDNRMTTVILPDGTTVSHAYDADGHRVQTTTTPPGGPATVTNYLVDTSGSLSHVVAETNAAGALTAYYVRGDDLLAVMRPTGPTTWATKYVHADGIGSIRQLTNEAGAITDTYAYSAFGEMLSHAGTDPQPYAFAGEPLDPNVGFQYHRARWLAPTNGRFLAMDSYPGIDEAPSTLNRYSYVSNNSVNKVDPSGQFESLTTLFANLSMLDTLRAFVPPGAGVTATKRPPTGKELLRDPFVQRQLLVAWRDSEADTEFRHEEGGWFYMNPHTRRVEVRRQYGRSGLNFIYLNSPPPPAISGSYVVADFHTHPNPPEDEWKAEPSRGDQEDNANRGVPGIVRTFTYVRGNAGPGLFVYGPTRRSSFSGPMGYPQ